MKSEDYWRMMRKANKSLRLANVGNPELPGVPGFPLTPQRDEPRPFDDSVLIVMRELLTQGIRPTTDEAGLNQNEKAYLEWLYTQGDLWIGIQCITLKMGHDLRFTPDFWALDCHGLRAIDTKGAHTWEDSVLKNRMAARLFPFFRFLLAKREGEVWIHTEIKP